MNSLFGLFLDNDLWLTQPREARTPSPAWSFPIGFPAQPWPGAVQGPLRVSAGDPGGGGIVPAFDGQMRHPYFEGLMTPWSGLFSPDGVRAMMLSRTGETWHSSDDGESRTLPFEEDATIEGGEGRDLIISGADDAELQGGDGDDRLIVSSKTANLVNGEGGNDYLAVVGAQSGHSTLSGGDGNDTLVSYTTAAALLGGEGDDYLRGFGFLDGGAGNDQIFGSRGDDILIDGEGNDYLAGNRGNDVLWATGGNDTLRGGRGDDQLVFSSEYADLFGGRGQDEFVFRDNTGTRNAMVHDFRVQDDRLLIDTSGNLSAQASYDYFLAHAIQAGDDILFTDPNGLSIRLADVDLDMLSVNNFADDTGSFTVPALSDF